MFYITENSCSGLINLRVYPLEVDIIVHEKNPPESKDGWWEVFHCVGNPPPPSSLFISSPWAAHNAVLSDWNQPQTESETVALKPHIHWKQFKTWKWASSSLYFANLYYFLPNAAAFINLRAIHIRRGAKSGKHLLSGIQQCNYNPIYRDWASDFLCAGYRYTN